MKHWAVPVIDLNISILWGFYSLKLVRKQVTDSVHLQSSKFQTMVMVESGPNGGQLVNTEVSLSHVLLKALQLLGCILHHDSRGFMDP